MNRDMGVLKHIVQAAHLVLEFQQGLDWERFTTDVKTQSAIIHQLFIMGEAVKRLSESFRLQHPEIPWSKIVPMREKLIHNYDNLNLQEVWDTAATDIPVMLPQIEPLLPTQDQT
jgi:uncharacterized protein with HEPN domain